MYEAVWQKNTEIVKMLLDAGAKITQSHHLLHYAILHRHEEMVRLLIDAGSIINLRDENGDTPLIVAAKTRQSRIARLLLENGRLLNCLNLQLLQIVANFFYLAGASVNSVNYVTGNSPLHEVIANMHSGSQSFDDMFSVLQEYDVNLNLESEWGTTPLSIALVHKLYDVAATLIRHGADVNNIHVSILPDMFSYVLLRGNFFLTELFIYAGYKIREGLPPSSPPIERWISQFKSNPMRLSDLCRICLRSLFKSKVYEKVAALNLPPVIQTFLKLEDIMNEGV